MALFKEVEHSKNSFPGPLAGMIAVPFKVTQGAINIYEQALQKGSETEIHNVLKTHPELLRDIMPRVGHHGTWICNKPQICPPLINGKKGKIPDMLIAGRNSNGMRWFIVELKGSSTKLFNRSATAFSSTVNEGLNQLASYISYGIEKQGAIRDALEIPDFKNPNGILLIGRESETVECKSKEELKAFWNQTMQKIEIISYDRILRTAKERLKFGA